MENIEFSEQVIRLILAAAVGMAIGLEREWREKAAGFRTLALVSLGSAAFMLLAANLVPDGSGRVAAGVITGIGFLGAGAILREHGEVLGLTTAAAVWMAAALGMAAAAGAVGLTLVGLAVALVVLLLSSFVDLTPVVRDSRLYDITYASTGWDTNRMSETIRHAGLLVSPVRIHIDKERSTAVWRATGSPARHERAIALLLEDETVVSLDVT